MRIRHNLSKAYLQYGDDYYEEADDMMLPNEGLPHLKGAAAPADMPMESPSDIVLPPGGKESYCAEDFFAPVQQTQQGESA